MLQPRPANGCDEEEEGAGRAALPVANGALAKATGGGRLAREAVEKGEGVDSMTPRARACPAAVDVRGGPSPPETRLVAASRGVPPGPGEKSAAPTASSRGRAAH